MITSLSILEYENLIDEARKIYEGLEDASVGTTMREASHHYWHLEQILATIEVIRNCRSCQLMKLRDPSLGNLKPLLLAPPLTRWAVEQAQVGNKIIPNAVE